MRRAAKVDANHADVVKAFRACGCAVRSSAALGDGFPDLVVAKGGKTWLVEVKDGDKSPSERRLTRLEQLFADFWPGAIYVVESVEQVPSCVKDATR